MKRKLIILACTALLFGLLAAACAKPPIEEMERATDAVTRAENNADAVTYAWNSIARAREALAQMNSEAASKRYDSAKAYAAEAIAAAERAISEGSAGAFRARNEASDLVSELRSQIDETKQTLDNMRSAQLGLDLDSVEQTIDEARTALSEDRYQDALNLSRTALSELTNIRQQVSAAAAAVASKK
ncbi:MAG: DUF4398 domain-containing protein [Treponema sp.]|nr:DUF4398 domain-containing protein [Treponema sp.]